MLMEICAAGILHQAGMLDWEVITVKLTDVLVQVRPVRKVVAISEEFSRSDDLEVLGSQLHGMLPVDPTYVFHEVGEFVAECPRCHRWFFRKDAPKVVHQCADCHRPLEFQ